MNKIGLKLWNINTDYYFDAAKELYDKGVFDYIELYIVPGYIDLISKWKELSIPFDIHAPHFAHNMNLSKAEFREDNFKKYIEVKMYADELKADVIVFHGGIGGDYKETAEQIKSLNDKRILIENKPLRPLKSTKGELCVGSRFDELKYIIDKSNCKFCLDIGHAVCSANSQNCNPYEYIELLTSLKPLRIHLSDIHIDSLTDEHLNYGDGNLDFRKVLQIIPENINITIETIKSSKTNLDDYERDARVLKTFL